MPSYVIGHRNPDTDAICSAIAYADLLSRTSMPEARAARCGEISARTAFVLQEAGLEHPALVMDVRPNAGGISRREVITSSEDDSLREAFHKMQINDLRSIPVLDAERRIVGMLSLLKLVELLLPTEVDPASVRRVSTNLERMRRTLDGTFQSAVDERREQEFVFTVAALSAEGFSERLNAYVPGDLVVVVGDRPTVQKPAIEFGARALVVTGGNRLSPELAALAVEKGTTVLLSPYDTATTTLLMKCSTPVSHTMWRDFQSFPENALVRNIREQVQNSALALYPVVDDAGVLLGVFSKSDLIKPEAVRLVMVDHNEYAQAVTGADEADIVEVIDHHRLGGGMTSREPIRFVNEPVGSTCTIVARMFRQAGLVPEPGIALCMAGGLISDTLNLTSPTTTAVDREIFLWLQECCGRDLGVFAQAFFSAGSVLQASTPDAAVRADCKDYTENGWKLAVAQVEEQGLDYFWTIKDELAASLDRLRRERGMDFACLLITDITRHYSLLLTAGHPGITGAIEYPKLEEGLFELDGIVSRKKQLLPAILSLLE